MKSFPITIVCGLFLLMCFFLQQGSQPPRQDSTGQTYADSLSYELRGRIKEMFDESPKPYLEGCVIAKQIVNLQDGGNMTIVAVEKCGDVFPCLQLDFEFAIGDSVQILGLAHRQPGTPHDFNQTYFAIPLK